MRKFPEKPSFKRWLVFGIKVGLIAEGVCLVGTYWVWHRMNTSQEFRRKMHQNFPTILNYYYLMGEKLGDLPTRQLDNEAWGVRKES